MFDGMLQAAILCMPNAHKSLLFLGEKTFTTLMMTRLAPMDNFILFFHSSRDELRSNNTKMELILVRTKNRIFGVIFQRCEWSAIAPWEALTVQSSRGAPITLDQKK